MKIRNLSWVLGGMMLWVASHAVAAERVIFGEEALRFAEAMRAVQVIGRAAQTAIDGLASSPANQYVRGYVFVTEHAGKIPTYTIVEGYVSPKTFGARRVEVVWQAGRTPEGTLQASRLDIGFVGPTSPSAANVKLEGADLEKLFTEVKQSAVLGTVYATLENLLGTPTSRSAYTSRQVAGSWPSVSVSANYSEVLPGMGLSLTAKGTRQRMQSGKVFSQGTFTFVDQVIVGFSPRPTRDFER